MKDTVEIVVFDEGKRNVSVLDDGRHVTLLLSVHHQRHKLVDDGHVSITTVIT